MRPTGQKKNEPLRCVFLVLLSATDMSKYTRLMEEIFSALISCVIGPGRAAPSPAAERAVTDGALGRQSHEKHGARTREGIICGMRMCEEPSEQRARTGVANRASGSVRYLRARGQGW